MTTDCTVERVFSVGQLQSLMAVLKTTSRYDDLRIKCQTYRTTLFFNTFSMPLLIALLMTSVKSDMCFWDPLYTPLNMGSEGMTKHESMESRGMCQMLEMLEILDIRMDDSYAIADDIPVRLAPMSIMRRTVCRAITCPEMWCRRGDQNVWTTGEWRRERRPSHEWTDCETQTGIQSIHLSAFSECRVWESIDWSLDKPLIASEVHSSRILLCLRWPPNRSTIAMGVEVHTIQEGDGMSKWYVRDGHSVGDQRWPLDWWLMTIQ